jgi:glycine cleavage system aminomethyltransferase T
MLNDDAGIIDDLIVYRIEKATMVVNASRRRDFAWLRSQSCGNRRSSSKTRATNSGLAIQDRG